MFFDRITRSTVARIKNMLGMNIERTVRQNAKPNPTLAKPAVTREETRHYTKADLTRRWLKRGERRPIEGDVAGALLALTAQPESALAAIRASRERLDGMHGRVLDIAPRLRDLCWAIDAASAEPVADEQPVEPAA